MKLFQDVNCHLTRKTKIFKEFCGIAGQMHISLEQNSSGRSYMGI